VALDIEDLRLVDDLLVAADGAHLTEQVQGLVANLEGEVRPQQDRPFIEGEGEFRGEASGTRLERGENADQPGDVFSGVRR
jgi:hypothetical protein